MRYNERLFSKEQKERFRAMMTNLVMEELGYKHALLEEKISWVAGAISKGMDVLFEKEGQTYNKDAFQAECRVYLEQCLLGEDREKDPYYQPDWDDVFLLSDGLLKLYISSIRPDFLADENTLEEQFLLSTLLFHCKECGAEEKVPVGLQTSAVEFFRLLGEMRTKECEYCLAMEKAEEYESELVQDTILAQQELEYFEGLTYADEVFFDDSDM